MMTKSHAQRGMTLVEVLVAVAIVMIAVLTMATTYLYSGNQTVEAFTQSEASRLMEAIRAYAVQDLVDSSTGRITDAVIGNADVPQTPLYGQPDMQTASLIHTSRNFVWRLAVAHNPLTDIDRSVRKHTCTVTIALDTERGGVNRGVYNAGDNVVTVCTFHLFDTEP